MKDMTKHCSLCGSTDREDTENGDQGYSACCNEPVEYGTFVPYNEDDEV